MVNAATWGSESFVEQSAIYQTRPRFVGIKQGVRSYVKPREANRDSPRRILPRGRWKFCKIILRASPPPPKRPRSTFKNPAILTLLGRVISASVETSHSRGVCSLHPWNATQRRRMAVPMPLVGVSIFRGARNFITTPRRAGLRAAVFICAGLYVDCLPLCVSRFLLPLRPSFTHVHTFLLCIYIYFARSFLLAAK